MRLNHEPVRSDCIFCMCSNDTRVAEYAAQLYLDGYAPKLVFSGGIGRFTEGLFNTSEAEAFALVAKDMGVPEQGDMSDEEYRQKKEEWQAQQAESTTEENQPEMTIKTTLTRYEFEKLPADRQEKILSMPERYTIID